MLRLIVLTIGLLSLACFPRPQTKLQSKQAHIFISMQWEYEYRCLLRDGSRYDEGTHDCVNADREFCTSWELDYNLVTQSCVDVPENQ